MPSLIDLMQEGREVAARQAHGRAPWSMRRYGDLRPASWRRDALSLLGLWGEPSTVHMAIMDEAAAEIAVVSLDCPDRIYPSVGMHHPPALRLERTVNDLFGLSARRLARYPPLARSQQLGRALPAGRSHRRIAEGSALSLPAGGRRRRAPDRGRPRARRNHRARTFPLHGKRRDRGPAGTAAGIYPQGHRGADDRRQISIAPSSSPDAYRATARSPMLTRFRRPPKRRSNSSCPIARSGCARCSPNSSGLPTISATSARSATMPPSR